MKDKLALVWYFVKAWPKWMYSRYQALPDKQKVYINYGLFFLTGFVVRWIL